MDPTYALMVIPLAVALASLIEMRRRGAFSPRAFDDAPTRQTGLSPIDLMVALLIMAVGMAAARPLLGAMGVPVDQIAGGAKDGEAGLTDMQIALVMLTGQLVTQLPIGIYIAARAAGARRGWRELGLVPRRPLRQLGGGLGMVIPAVAIVLSLNFAIALLGGALGLEAPESGHRMLQRLRQTPDARALAIMLISALAAAPMLEELIFRGLLQSALLTWLGARDRWAVIGLAALLFAAVHINVVAWQVLPGLAALGVMLGWLYEKHGSLLPPIALHVGFNAVMVLLAFAQTSQQ